MPPPNASALGRTTTSARSSSSSLRSRARPGLKLTARRKKLLQSSLAERDEAASPVLKKVHRAGSVEPDPLRGLFEVTLDGIARVVEYEPDSDLRDTEQVPLLEDGGIEAFIRREVLPLRPRRVVRRLQRQDRVRDQLHPLLLQAGAAALAR